MAKLLSFSNKSGYPDALLKEAATLAAKLLSLPPKCMFHVTIQRGWGCEHSGLAKKGWRYTDHQVFVHAECPDFIKTLVHEFYHVKDFCMGKKFGQYNRRWANRPHEKRAVRGTAKLLTSDKLSERKKAYRARLFEIRKELENLMKMKAKKREKDAEKANEKVRKEKGIREELGADIWMPSTLVKAWWTYRDRIDSVEYHRSQWGGVRIEMWTKDGWCFDPETHCEFEYSCKDAIDQMRYVERCDCESCKEKLPN